ncbi:MAG: hypothetical protein GWO24_22245, partial [Akkermansiaceae bacterium]|nr:hypothetical protein [Akkermansiaceae bacterium]
QTSRAMAQLAARLRKNKSDAFAARRLMSVLTYREFALPLRDFRHETGVRAVDLSPDGRVLATLSTRGMLTLWDLEKGKRSEVKAGQFWWYGMFSHLSVDYNKDGTQVVTPGGKECAAKIWDVAGEPELAVTIESPEAESDFGHAEFSPDGEKVVAITRQGMAFVWDAGSGEKLLDLETESFGQDATLVYCSFLLDGAYIVTSVGMRPTPSGPDFQWKEAGISVWDSRTGKRVNHLVDSAYLKYGGPFFTWKETVVAHPSQTKLTYLNAQGRLTVWDYLKGTRLDGRERHGGA